MDIIVRFILDDATTATQRTFEKKEDWPWPWPPQAGLAVQVRGMRGIALEISRVIYNMNDGAIVVDFLGERLGGNVEGAADELQRMGYRPVP